MAPRGRKPRPAALRKLNKSPARKVRADSTSASVRTKTRPPGSVVPEAKMPVVQVAIPNVPDAVALNPLAAAAWKRLTKDLKAMRVITGNDWATLEAMALAYSRAVQAEEHVRTHGVMINDVFRGWKANPAVSIARSEWAEVRRYAIEFGLTPSSRTRISQVEDPSTVPLGVTKGKESAEDFLFKGAGGRVIGAIGA